MKVSRHSESFVRRAGRIWDGAGKGILNHILDLRVNVLEQALIAKKTALQKGHIAEGRWFVALIATFCLRECESCAELAFDLFTNARFIRHDCFQFQTGHCRPNASISQGWVGNDVLRQRNLLPQHNTFKRPFQVRCNADVSEQMPRKQFPANIVGPQIRKARYQLDLSQEQLATRCQLLGLDISRSTLAQIEICVRFVSDQELLVLASVLGVTTDDLFPKSIKNRFISTLSKQTRAKSNSRRRPA